MDKKVFDKIIENAFKRMKVPHHKSVDEAFIINLLKETFEEVEKLNATTGISCLYIRLVDWKKFKQIPEGYRE